MRLTTRQYELLMYLMEQDDFVVISNIAENFNLSTRTVQREMNKISEYLGDNSDIIEKKAGKGIRFVGSSADRKRLCENMPHIPELVPAYSQTERIYAILNMLLMDDEPRKILSFTRRLGVSEATVGNDLNICDTWLQTSNIVLVRKQGVGIYIEAPENLRRQALIRLYYEQSGQSRKDSDSGCKVRLNAKSVRNLFRMEIMEKLEKILSVIPEMNAVNSNDKLRYALVVHLYIIYLRVSQGSAIMTSSGPADDSRPEIRLSNIILKRMEAELQVHIPPGETEYLGTILKCTHGLNGLSDEETEYRARRVVSRLIKKAESLSGVMLDNTGVFSEALMRHLIPAMQRMELNMDIRNPMQNDIKEHYASLYELAMECCSVIEDELLMPVPEEEICYIALHLGVALEDSRSYQSRRFRAVVCCPSGMVTAKLLALRIGREFSNIEIVGVLPTQNIDYDDLNRKCVDVIISTVGLVEPRIPGVYVSSFLNDDEKQKIWKLLDSLKQKPVKQKNDEYTNFSEELLMQRDTIDTALQLMNNFFLKEDRSIKSMASAIELAGNLAGGDKGKEIVNDLARREQIGSTNTADGRIVLLHCRTCGTDQAWFGVIRPGRLVVNGSEAKTILLMLAPSKASKQTLSLMSSLTEAVVDSESFADTMIYGNEDQCRDAVKKILSTNYKLSF